MRRRRRQRRASAQIGALLALAIPEASAFGQSANISPPPERFAIAPGGVDMRSGRYVYNQTDMVIGPEGGGLSLARTLAQPVIGHTNPFANFSHNWEMMITEKRIDIQGGHFTHSTGYPDYQIEIVTGGLSQTFRAQGTFSFEQVSRSGWGRLSDTGGRTTSAAVYTLQTGDGSTAVFRAMGSNDCSSQLRCAYIDYLVRPDGTRFDFGYDNAGSNATRLRTVTSNRGYALLFEYDSGRISKACLLNLAATTMPSGLACPSGVPTTTYSYTTVSGVSKMASATDASGGVWSFGYSGSNMSFTRPGESTAWLTNTIQQRTDDDGLVSEIVDSQSLADGSSYTYGWTSAPAISGHVSPIAGGSFSDSAGTVTLDYDFPTQPYDPAQGHGNVSGETPGDSGSPIVQQTTPGPVRVTDALGHVTTTDYCEPSLMASLPSSWMHRCLVMPVPASVTSPMGIKTVMTWDIQLRHLTNSRQIQRAAVGSEASQADIVQQASYDCSLTNFRFCDQPVTRTDPNGNVTNYNYSATHGGLLSVTLPAPASGAARPQTRHSYAERHAWVSNGSGGYTQVATGVYVRTATSTCRTSAASTSGSYAPCSAGGDEVLTQYDYGPDSGPNNLLLRGMTVTATDGGTTTTLRTCYTYDARGRRISETQPNANLTSCP